MRDGGQGRHRGTDAQRDGQHPYPAHVTGVARSGMLISGEGIGNGHGCSISAGDKAVHRT